MLLKLLLLALAGSLGTLARYGMTLGIHRIFGPGFPWGTLLVNVLGCGLFGLVWAATEEAGARTAEIRLIVLAGFMGAFTTFSTFAFDTGQYLSRGEWLHAGANLALSNLVGIAALLAGLWLGNRL
jgi:CrcB protein